MENQTIKTYLEKEEFNKYKILLLNESRTIKQDIEEYIRKRINK